MQIEKLEDILTINFDKLKSPEKTRLLVKIKQLIKSENKTEALATENAQDLPYEGLSIVGNKYVELRFDLDTKQARVTGVRQDPRDVKGRNYMSGAEALLKVKTLAKDQKEIENE